MPELPDLELYLDRLTTRIAGTRLDAIRIKNPFLLRSVEPPPAACIGRSVTNCRRLGKRLAIGLEGDTWLVLHLMIAGRLQWHTTPAALGGRHVLAAFDFTSGSLQLTEAGSRKRASLHVVQGASELAAHDPGGLEPLACDFAAFRERLQRENRTLKRALTSPRLFAGIGNAYSDEILHAARLSPTLQTGKLDDAGQRALFAATQRVLRDWCVRLDAQFADRFPDKVTAFRPDMSVHGRYGKPCPDCGTAVQRIRYKDNETNYCPVCQTGGRIFADRSLSRLLKDDWPRAVEE